MHLAYLAITLVAALANGYAAVLNLVGADSVKLVADRVHVSRTWMVPFGCLLAAGAVGLLSGLAVPRLGAVAATGLVLYFACAISAHVRARDSNFGGAVFFLVLAVGSLAANVGYHGLS
jgi:hypothetical protein